MTSPYAIEVRYLGGPWEFVAYVIAESGPKAIAKVKPPAAPDHWEYRATLVKPINGTIRCAEEGGLFG